MKQTPRSLERTKNRSRPFGVELPKPGPPPEKPLPASGAPPADLEDDTPAGLVRAQLRQLAKGFQVLRHAGLIAEAGQPLSFSLQPFPAGLGVTFLLDQTLELVGTLTGPVTGTLGKLTSALSLNQLAGAVAITGTLDGVASGDGVPDLSSTLDTVGPGLTNTLPLTIPVGLPVQVEVSWTAALQTSAPGAPLETVPAGDGKVRFLEGAAASLTSLVFLPRFAPLTGENLIQPPDTFWVTATARLTIDPSALPLLGGLASAILGSEPITEEIPLPALPIIVPVLPLPKLLVLFRHKLHATMKGQEEGFALIVVPPDSPIGSIEQLGELLNPITAVVQNLALLSLAEDVLAPFRSLLGALRAVADRALLQPHIRLLAASSHADLKKLVMIKESRFGVDELNRDIRAGRRISSLVLIGPDGTKADLYNAPDLNPDRRSDKGKLTVTVDGRNAVVIRDLERDVPVTDPPGRATADPKPGPLNTFNNDIESFELV